MILSELFLTEHILLFKNPIRWPAKIITCGLNDNGNLKVAAYRSRTCYCEAIISHPNKEIS
jgi:hypothetical protein